jgi:REP element-mobilizing transposase RayT
MQEVLMRKVPGTHARGLMRKVPGTHARGLMQKVPGTGIILARRSNLLLALPKTEAEVAMARPLRFIPPDSVVEVTCRTIQGRRLFRPSAEMNELLLGVLGRSLTLHPTVQLHAFVFAWNHVHLLVSVPDAHALASFMNHLSSNVAREAGRLHDWKDKVWSRRYRSIVVIDEESQLSRLRYIMSHGVKERWVDRPADWPGASSISTLTDGVVLTGLWIDRGRESRASRRKGPLDPATYQTRYHVPIAPLPCWRDLCDEERRARCRDLAAQIENDHAEAGRSPARPALGAAQVLATDPHSLPEVLKRSPAPMVHAATIGRRIEFIGRYRSFQERFYVASDEMSRTPTRVAFPACSFPSRPPFQAAVLPMAG